AYAGKILVRKAHNRQSRFEIRARATLTRAGCPVAFHPRHKKIEKMLVHCRFQERSATFSEDNQEIARDFSRIFGTTAKGGFPAAPPAAVGATRTRKGY